MYSDCALKVHFSSETKFDCYQIENEIKKTGLFVVIDDRFVQVYALHRPPEEAT